MLPHCTVHMLLLKTISLRFSHMKLNGCRLWDGPVVFSVWRISPPPSLQQAFRGMPPLASQPFGAEWHAFWRIVDHITVAFPQKSDPRYVSTWKSNNRTSPLIKMLLCQHLAFFLAWARMNIYIQWQWPRGIPPARRVFLGKILGLPARLAASHVNSQSPVNPRFTLIEKTEGKWTQGMPQDSCEAHFLWKKTRNVGAVDRITYRFTITLNPRRVLLEKTQGIWTGCCDACFPWKKIRKSGGHI